MVRSEVGQVVAVTYGGVVLKVVLMRMTLIQLLDIIGTMV